MAIDDMGYVKNPKRRSTELLNVNYSEKASQDLSDNRPRVEIEVLPANKYKYTSLPCPGCC